MHVEQGDQCTRLAAWMRDAKDTRMRWIDERKEDERNKQVDRLLFLTFPHHDPADTQYKLHYRATLRSLPPDSTTQKRAEFRSMADNARFPRILGMVRAAVRADTGEGSIDWRVNLRGE